MPIPRYSSSSSTAGGVGGSSSSRRLGSGAGADGGSDVMYSLDTKSSSVYRSSPDLSHAGSLSNRRSSSTDGSTDGSYYGGGGGGGGHSRQSSDSVDYPTRRYSTTTSGRKTSASANPLQFIKGKGATELAMTAEEQMKQAAETKRLKSVETLDGDDNTDWQSNLSSWKNRRKSQSEKSYQMKEELERMEREKDGEQAPTTSMPTKTFSQMKEERERRKSAPSKHFYPIEDEAEADDDIFASVTSEPSQSSPAERSSSRYKSATTGRETSQESKPSRTIRDTESRWKQEADIDNNDEEEQAEDSKSKTPPSTTTTTGTTTTASTTTTNNNSYKTGSSSESRESSRFSADLDSGSMRQRRSEAQEYGSRDSWRKSYSDRDSRENAAKENNRNSANSSSAAKSSNKISNILRSFEQKEEGASRPKSGGGGGGAVDAGIDIGARRKSFEKFGALSGAGDSALRSSYASSKSSGKDYVEKNIKISQKANNDRGFGFTLAGGADKKQPVVVEKVALGGAADVCELQAKDEVIAVNGKSVAGLTSSELNLKVKDAVRVGLIELRVKRYLGSGGEFDDDEDFLSTDEEIDTPDRSVSKSSSVRAENSFDSLDSRDDHQKPEVENERHTWNEDQISSPSVTPQSSRRGDPTSTSSDSGYDAQTFSPYHRGDHSSNEEEITPPEPQTEIQKRPTLADKTRHLSYPREEEDEEEADYVNMQSTTAYRGTMAREVIPVVQTEVELRPSITVRREVVNVSQEDGSKPQETSIEARFEAQPPPPPPPPASRREEEKKQEEENTDNDSDGGPPAALRKWQRQRARVEYTFESDERPKFYDQMKLTSSSSLSSQSQRQADDAQDDAVLYKATQDYDEAVHSQRPLSSTTRSFNLGGDRQRMREWNQQQEEERMPSEASHTGVMNESPVEVNFPFDQQRFIAQREQMDQQYQADLQRADDSGRLKQEQERQMLEPEMEKARLLEERRAQRQARLQQLAQENYADNDDNNAVRASSSSPSYNYTSTPPPHRQQEQQQTDSSSSSPSPAPAVGRRQRHQQQQQQQHLHEQQQQQVYNATAPSPSDQGFSPTPSVSQPGAYRASEEVHSGIDDQQSHTSTYTAQLQGGQPTTQVRPPEVLIIDPRNRADFAGQPLEVVPPGQPCHFQVKINSRDTPQGLLIQPQMVSSQYAAPAMPDHEAFLEAERERIRQEELQKIEAERRRQEEEERKQIRQKEENLRMQEEMLRLQQEEIRRTKEQLERERQQLQQQRSTSTPPTPPQQQSSSSQRQQDYGPPPANSPHDALRFETVTSKVRGGSPAYSSTVVQGPRRSEHQPQTSGSYSDRRGGGGGGSYSDRAHDGYGVRRSEPNWSSSSHNAAPQNQSWRGGNSQPTSASQTSLPKWPPQSGGSEHGSRGGGAGGGSGSLAGQYSREDMLAMNRKATPLQAKPPSPHPPHPDQPEVLVHHPHQAPVKREAPSKGQIHSLNSVPKAKLLNPDQWIEDEPVHHNQAQHQRHHHHHHHQPLQDDHPPGYTPRRLSDAYRNQFSAPQDHWLVQEAERRRMNKSQGSGSGSRGSGHISGPIQPATDDYGNRWRGGSDGVGEARRPPNMPAQIRQTLLQKTANVRGSNGSSHSPPPPPVATHNSGYYHNRQQPPNDSAPNLSQTLPADYSYGGGYHHQPGSRSQAMPPQHRAPSPDNRRENGVGVSGKQLCSHCNQELGFGAAMVIESLGLFYHTQCFRCCVCRTPLGSGVEGADVRVRVNKLHCPNCYSNDEAGLKFSKV